jgi:hypothetical protein
MYSNPCRRLEKASRYILAFGAILYLVLYIYTFVFSFNCCNAISLGPFSLAGKNMDRQSTHPGGQHRSGNKTSAVRRPPGSLNKHPKRSSLKNSVRQEKPTVEIEENTKATTKTEEAEAEKKDEIKETQKTEKTEDETAEKKVKTKAEKARRI